MWARALLYLLAPITPTRWHPSNPNTLVTGCVLCGEIPLAVRVPTPFQSNNTDRLYWETLQLFNRYDLYTKTDSCVDMEEARVYYKGLIQGFFGATDVGVSDVVGGVGARVVLSVVVSVVACSFR